MEGHSVRAGMAPSGLASLLKQHLAVTSTSDAGSALLGLPATDVPARMFGGQLLAQGLAAAAAVVGDGSAPASLHALLLRPGSANEPVEYLPEMVRQGRSFSTVSVRTVQGPRLLASATSTWQRPETWREETDRAMPPEIDGEEELPHPAPGVLTSAFDMRWLNAGSHGRGLWFRAREPLQAGSLVHAYAALYLSDLWAADPLVRWFGERFDSPRVRVSTLSHTAWFHVDFSVDDWLYLEMLPARTAGGRGLVQSVLRSQDGDRLATFAQEASLRPRTRSE